MMIWLNWCKVPHPISLVNCSGKSWRAVREVPKKDLWRQVPKSSLKPTNWSNLWWNAIPITSDALNPMRPKSHEIGTKNRSSIKWSTWDWRKMFAFDEPDLLTDVPLRNFCNGKIVHGVWKSQKMSHLPLHIVWKLLKMSHLNFWIVAFSTNFCPIKIDLSGNTVSPQALLEKS